ncbi:MAG TPA: hypothetical protein VK978_01875 [Candidatus Saccharimonadales bacterium]|nr:hypothetical protein [Candidatus Saccharimonadales bacterium]
MKNAALHQFIEQVMAIQPGIAGLYGAASGITGTTGTEGVIGERLKADALAFAAERGKVHPDREDLLELARTLEGSLQAARLVSGISDATLERLLGQLHDLCAI